VDNQGNPSGRAIIDFSSGLSFVDQVQSLNSTNEGPLFFKVKLIINPINGEKIASSEPSGRRALEANDPYEF